jgi:hypothetical protein
MSNPYENYYINQAGSGIAGFSGVKYQKGHGFFGRIFSNAILPILKYLGKKAINTGVGIGSDYLAGEDIKSSAKRRLKSTGLDIAEDALERVKKQRGTGRRRYKRTVKSRRTKRKPTISQLKALAKGRKKLRKKYITRSRKRSKSIDNLF